MELVMPDIIYVPFDRELYDDVIRFSDGRLDPVDLADNQLRSWIENSLEFGDAKEWAEDRLEELAGKYAPQVLKRWKNEDAQQLRQRSAESRPLVWKEVTIPSGSEVRMFYNGTHHYAAIKSGKIVDHGTEYSPSEWASKIAAGTSRNAWRDLWFKEPLSKTWVPAQLLRNQAREKIGREAGPQDSQGATP
jgi:hypothetical protein